jgi:hypothetical protein
MEKRGEIFGMEVWVDPDMPPDAWKLVSAVPPPPVCVPREPRQREVE